MRADRLLAMLMLLQTRGTLTARQLAEELEVSERTIYRDITALNSAGVPVYTESGPGGGISLVESYRTDLTGLRAEEAQALSMLDIPEPLIRLGVGSELKAALLKLSAAVPASLRQRQTQARQRIHLDAAWWFQDEDPTPTLQTLQQAVWQDRLLRLRCRGDFNTLSELLVAPYGLVAKTNIWYLVYAFEGQLRARRVSRIIEAEIQPEGFTRPPDFDLAAFWQTWCRDFEQERPRFTIRIRVAPWLKTRLPQILLGKHPETTNSAPQMDKDGWEEISLTFESFEAARTRILGFGSAVEVLEPPALRTSVADFGRQIAAVYASPTT